MSNHNQTFLGKVFLIALPILMCLITIAMYCKVSVLKTNMIEGDKSVALTQDVYSILTKTIYDAWLYDGLQMDDSYLIDSENENFDSYKDYFLEKDQLLVCRISENHCESCVDYILGKINALSSDSTFNMGIIVMGEYSKMALKILSQKLSLNSKIELRSVVGTILPVDDIGFPYMFVVDGYNNVSNVYAPDKRYSQLTDAYFELLKNRYQ